VGAKSRSPLVSVIIPTYNRAHLLGRAIQSVLNQTYQDFELIIVDDASSDNTEEVVKSFHDDRIKYIRHDENKGAGAARNTGIKAARGEYIAFQDDDDKWLPNKLEKQVKVLEDSPPEIGVVYTDFQRFDKKSENKPKMVKVMRISGDIHGALLEDNFIGTPTVLVKKQCFEKVGMFDEELPQLEDWELWIRISKYYHFRYIKEPLVDSYEVAGGISSNAPAHIVARELILKKHFEDISQNSKLLAEHIYGIGTDLCHQGETKRGRSYILQAIKVYPFNIKFLLAAFVSLFGSKIYNKIAEIKRAVMPSHI